MAPKYPMAPKYYRNPPSPPREPVSDRKLDDATHLRSPSPSPIPLPNKQEREEYYFGLPSQPPLLARTSTAVWDPLGPDGCPKERRLRPVGYHKIKDSDWQEQRDIMTQEIINTLNTHGVTWTSVGFLRIGHEEDFETPLILWIGVHPGTLINEDGSPLPTAGKVAIACKQVLEKYDILDIDCEMRESADCYSREDGDETSKRKKRPNRSRKY